MQLVIVRMQMGSMLVKRYDDDFYDNQLTRPPGRDEEEMSGQHVGILPRRLIEPGIVNRLTTALLLLSVVLPRRLSV